MATKDNKIIHSNDAIYADALRNENAAAMKN